jgi:hypothetical protein
MLLSRLSSLANLEFSVRLGSHFLVLSLAVVTSKVEVSARALLNGDLGFSPEAAF